MEVFLEALWDHSCCWRRSRHTSLLLPAVMMSVLPSPGRLPSTCLMTVTECLGWVPYDQVLHEFFFFFSFFLVGYVEERPW